jgi:hypothetical protein
MKIIESVKNFILTCPYLADLAAVNVDFLPDSPDTYSVEGVPANSVIETYLDGSQVRQFVFVFASRFYYSDETRNNLENSGFYEAFSDWLDEQTKTGNLPIMREGLTPSKIEAMSSGYLFDVSGDLSNARYQIQCRLIYDKE